MLIEFLDRTIKTPEEIERKLGLPTLAVIHDLSETGKAYGDSSYGYGYGYGAEPASAAAGTARPRSLAGRVEKKKGAPQALGQIELVPHERPRTLISETYRSLRTALLLSLGPRSSRWWP